VKSATRATATSIGNSFRIVVIRLLIYVSLSSTHFQAQGYFLVYPPPENELTLPFLLVESLRFSFEASKGSHRQAITHADCVVHQLNSEVASQIQSLILPRINADERGV